MKTKYFSGVEKYYIVLNLLKNSHFVRFSVSRTFSISNKSLGYLKVGYRENVLYACQNTCPSLKENPKTLCRGSLKIKPLCVSDSMNIKQQQQVHQQYNYNNDSATTTTATTTNNSNSHVSIYFCCEWLNVYSFCFP